MKKILIFTFLIFLTACTSTPPNFENCFQQQQELCKLVLSGESNPQLTPIDPRIPIKNETANIGDIYWLNCGKVGPNNIGLKVFEKDDYLCEITEPNAMALFTNLTQDEAIPYFDLIYEPINPETGDYVRYTIYNQTADRYLINIDPLCENGFSSAKKKTSIIHEENFYDIQRVIVKNTTEAGSAWLQDIRVREDGLTRVDKEKFIKECPK